MNIKPYHNCGFVSPNFSCLLKSLAIFHGRSESFFSRGEKEYAPSCVYYCYHPFEKSSFRMQRLRRSRVAVLFSLCTCNALQIHGLAVDPLLGSAPRVCMCRHCYVHRYIVCHWPNNPNCAIRLIHIETLYSMDPAGLLYYLRFPCVAAVVLVVAPAWRVKIELIFSRTTLI